MTIPPTPRSRKGAPEKKAFADFIDKGITFDAIKDVSPVFEDKPMNDQAGRLILKGHYPTKPKRLRFDLKYLPEGPVWKLVGINITAD